MSDKVRGKRMTALESQKALELEAERAISFGSTAKLEHWEPSTCFCPKCGSNNSLINTMYVLTSYPEQYSFKCRDCGHTWTGAKHYGIPPMRTWPDLNEDVIAVPAGNYGWICPKCGSVYSPGTTECKRCAMPWYPTITCQGEIGGTTNLAPSPISGESNIATVGECKRADYQAGREENDPVNVALRYESFMKQHGE